MIDGFKTVFKKVTYIDDGMEVYWLRGRSKMLLCRVVCAMGDTARVVNELHRVDTWANIDELYLKTK